MFSFSRAIVPRCDVVAETCGSVAKQEPETTVEEASLLVGGVSTPFTENPNKQQTLATREDSVAVAEGSVISKSYELANALIDSIVESLKQLPSSDASELTPEEEEAVAELFAAFPSEGGANVQVGPNSVPIAEMNTASPDAHHGGNDEHSSHGVSSGSGANSVASSNSMLEQITQLLTTPYPEDDVQLRPPAWWLQRDEVAQVFLQQPVFVTPALSAYETYRKKGRDAPISQKWKSSEEAAAGRELHAAMQVRESLFELDKQRTLLNIIRAENRLGTDSGLSFARKVLNYELAHKGQKSFGTLVNTEYKSLAEFYRDHPDESLPEAEQNIVRRGMTVVSDTLQNATKLCPKMPQVQQIDALARVRSMVESTLNGEFSPEVADSAIDANSRVISVAETVFLLVQDLYVQASWGGVVCATLRATKQILGPDSPLCGTVDRFFRDIIRKLVMPQAESSETLPDSEPFRPWFERLTGGAKLSQTLRSSGLATLVTSLVTAGLAIAAFADELPDELSWKNIFRLTSKQGTATTMVDSILDAARYILTYGKAILTNGSLNPLFESTSSSSEISVQVADLLSAVHLYESGLWHTSRYRAMSVFESEYSETKDYLQSKIAETTTASPKHKMYSEMYRSLSHSVEAARRKATTSTFRRQPYGIMLHGKSGVGKSTISGKLIRFLSRVSLAEVTTDALRREGKIGSEERVRLGCIPATEDCFQTIDGMDKYESDVNPRCMGLLLDDVGNMKELPDHSTVAGRLVRYINNTPVKAVKAVAEEKGVMEIQPEIVLGSTNLDSEYSGGSNWPDSVLRRTVHIEQTVIVPEILQGDSIHPALLDAWRKDNPEKDKFGFERIYAFDVFYYHPETRARILLRDQHGKLMEGVDMEQLWSYLEHEVRMHVRAQLQVFHARKHEYEIKLCPTPGHTYVEGCCPLCNPEQALAREVDYSTVDFDAYVAEANTSTTLRLLHFAAFVSMRLDWMPIVGARLSFIGKRLRWLWMLRVMCDERLWWGLPSACVLISVGLYQLVREYLPSFGWFFVAIVATSFIFLVEAIRRYCSLVVLRDRRASSAYLRAYNEYARYAALGSGFLVGLYAIQQLVKTFKAGMRVAESLELQDTPVSFPRFQTEYSTMEERTAPLGEITTVTPSQLAGIVSKSVADLIWQKGPKDAVRFQGMFITSDILLVPKHCVTLPDGSIRTGMYSIATQSRSGGDDSGFVRTKELVAKHVFFGPHETAFVFFPGTGSRRDLRNYFASDYDTSGCGHANLVTFSDEVETGKKVFPVSMCAYDTQVAMTRADGGVIQAGPCCSYTINKQGVESANGWCGAPLLSHYKGTACISGFHVFGKSSYLLSTKRVSGAQMVLRRDVDDAIRYFQTKTVANCVGYSHVPAKLMGKELPLGDAVHPKNAVARCGKGLTVVGVNEESRARPRTGSRLSPISEHLCEDVDPLPLEHGPPPHMRGVISKGEPFRHYVREISAESHDMPLELLLQAGDEMVETYFEAMDGDAFKQHIRPLQGFEQIMAGIEGVPYVNQVPMSTSVGYPHNKKKNLFATQEYIGEDGSRRKRWVWDEDFKKAVEENAAVAARGERPSTVFCAHMKDEHVKLSKEKTRIFQAASLPLQMLLRQYFLPLVASLSRGIKKSECAVGIDMQSPEFDELTAFMMAKGNNHICGDFKSFDLRMSSQVTTVAWDVLIRLAERVGYPPEDIVAMRATAADVIWPLAQVDGTIVLVNGSNPSGHNLTVYINSLVNSIYHRVAFYALRPEGCTATFADAVRLMTYGDDCWASVAAEYPWYNHTALQKYFATLGLEYTMADKDSESRPYVPIEEVEFLKCKPLVTTEVVGRKKGRPFYTARMCEATLSKMLHCYMESVESPEEVISSNVRSVLQMLIFDPGAFYRMQNRLRRVCAAVDNERDIGIAWPLELTARREDLVKAWTERHYRYSVKSIYDVSDSTMPVAESSETVHDADVVEGDIIEMAEPEETMEQPNLAITNVVDNARYSWNEMLTRPVSLLTHNFNAGDASTLRIDPFSIVVTELRELFKYYSFFRFDLEVTVKVQAAMNIAGMLQAAWEPWNPSMSATNPDKGNTLHSNAQMSGFSQMQCVQLYVPDQGEGKMVIPFRHTQDYVEYPYANELGRLNIGFYYSHAASAAQYVTVMLVGRLVNVSLGGLDEAPFIAEGTKSPVVACDNINTTNMVDLYDDYLGLGPPTNRPYVRGRTDDDMDVANLCAIPTTVHGGQIKNDTSAGAVVARFEVTPFIRIGAESLSVPGIVNYSQALITPAAMCGLPYTRWRGRCKMKIHFVANVFHRGIFRVGYSNPRVADHSSVPFSQAITRVADLQSNRTVELDIPWMSGSYSKKCGDFGYDLTIPTHSGNHPFADMSKWPSWHGTGVTGKEFNGVVTIVAQTPLTYTDLTALPVEMLVTVSWHDMEFFNYNRVVPFGGCRGIITADLTSEEMQAMEELVLAEGPGVIDDQEASDKAPLVIGSHHKTDGVLCAKHYPSLLQYLQRVSSTTPSITGALHDFNFSNHYAVSQVTHNVGTSTTHVRFNYGQSFMHLLTNSFMGWRGSVVFSTIGGNTHTTGLRLMRYQIDGDLSLMTIGPLMVLPGLGLLSCANSAMNVARAMIDWGYPANFTRFRGINDGREPGELVARTNANVGYLQPANDFRLVCFIRAPLLVYAMSTPPSLRPTSGPSLSGENTVDNGKPGSAAGRILGFASPT